MQLDSDRFKLPLSKLSTISSKLSKLQLSQDKILGLQQHQLQEISRIRIKDKVFGIKIILISVPELIREEEQAAETTTKTMNESE